ncbi:MULTISPECIES: hypothetical protein [Pectobacterium]|uniref:hypothetical protein n=1 Tax=Pectobacterium TaxID=122277 RepID=UPI0018871749|nr:hypothetical protein [Pectobacterium carotovorum]
MTLQTSTIKRLLLDDYNFGIFITDEDERKKTLALDIQELEKLQTVLSTFISDVTAYQINERHNREQELEGKKSALKELLEKSDIGLSFEQLGELFGQQQQETKAKTKSVTTQTAKSYTVVFQGQEYKTTNKVLPASLRKNGAYEALLKTSPEYQNVEVFLREHSKDYRDTFPLNAQYKGVEFHLNSRGKLNATALDVFKKYLKDHSGATEQDFKAAVAKG